MDTQENPYASPTADIGSAPSEAELLADPERVRNEYLKHESKVRAACVAFHISAAVFVLVLKQAKPNRVSCAEVAETHKHTPTGRLEAKPFEDCSRCRVA